jgi:hypothetical protein
MTMGEVIDFEREIVEQSASKPRPTPVTDQLNKILALLRQRCPPNCHISFDFNGQLHVHVDVRNREEVAATELILPTMGDGLFHSLKRGATPRHPFFHRVSAIIAA